MVLNSFISWSARFSRSAWSMQLQLALLWMAGSSLLGLANAQGNPLTLCSSENTGSQSFFFAGNSYGKCTEYCVGYAYAIMQDMECYCSNTSPGTTVGLSECSDSCPGYGYDKCGNKDQGLYGYAQIGQPSSTQAVSTSTTSSSSSSSTAAPLLTSTTATSGTSTTSTTSSSSSSTQEVAVTTVVKTVAPPTTLSSTTSTHSTTSYSSSSSSPTFSSTASPSSTPHSTSISSGTSTSLSASASPSTSPASGSAAVTTSSTPQSTQSSQGTSIEPSPASTARASTSTKGAGILAPNNNSADTHQGFWHNHSAVGGVFAVVGIAGLALILAAAFLIWRRRKRQQTAALSGLGIAGLSHSDSGSPTTPGSAEKMIGTGSTHSSQRKNHAFFALAKDGTTTNTYTPMGSPNTGTGLSHMRTSSGLSESDLKLVPIFDQRVDPNQIYMRWEHGQSTYSLQDNEDYSRKVLRVANPGAQNGGAAASDDEDAPGRPES